MPNLKSEAIQVGNKTWLGSLHGLENCRSGVVDVSTFTANTHFPKGFLLSGIPLGRRTSDDAWVLYNAAGSGGAQNLEGFLADERVVVDPAGKVNAPILQHGFINVDKLPVTGFTPPSSAKQFVFVGAGV